MQTVVVRRIRVQWFLPALILVLLVPFVNRGFLYAAMWALGAAVLTAVRPLVKGKWLEIGLRVLRGFVIFLCVVATVLSLAAMSGSTLRPHHASPTPISLKQGA